MPATIERLADMRKSIAVVVFASLLLTVVSCGVLQMPSRADLESLAHECAVKPDPWGCVVDGAIRVIGKDSVLLRAVLMILRDLLVNLAVSPALITSPPALAPSLSGDPGMCGPLINWGSGIRSKLGWDLYDFDDPALSLSLIRRYYECGGRSVDGRGAEIPLAGFESYHEPYVRDDMPTVEQASILTDESAGCDASLRPEWVTRGWPMPKACEAGVAARAEWAASRERLLSVASSRGAIVLVAEKAGADCNDVDALNTYGEYLIAARSRYHVYPDDVELLGIVVGRVLR